MTISLSLLRPRTILLPLLLLLIPLLLSATTYTAVVSGDWSSSLTWGGNAPGTDITSGDQIIINANVTVTMDVDVSINHQLALMTLFGTLSSANHQLTVTAGTIAGTGDLLVQQVKLGTTGFIVATGNVEVDLLETASNALVLGANVKIQQALKISAGSFSVGITGALVLQADAAIEMAGGSFMADPSLVQTAGSIHLIYSGQTQTNGAETSIGTIANLTVDLSTANDSLTLSGNLTVSDTLNLTTGHLVLSSHNLTLNGTVLNSAQASITGSPSSGLILNGTGNISPLFTQNGAMLDTFVVNQTNGNVTLTSSLTVGGTVDLQQGSLVLNGHTLTVTGTWQSSVGAAITGSPTSGLALGGIGDISLVFSQNGAVLDTFIVHQSNGNVTLNTDLTVVGNLELQQGSLILNGGTLTINGLLETAAGATITGSATSGLILNGTGNIAPVFAANGAILDTLVVNQTNGNLTLVSNLTVGSNLNLVQGSLILNGHNLTVNGSLETSAGASITGSATSGLNMGGTGNVWVIFSQNGSLLDTFIVNKMNGSVTLNADLLVGSSVDLQQGSLVLNGHNLTVNGTIATSGGADITGSATSTLTLDGTGNASLVFSPTGAILGALVVSQMNGNVALSADLTVENTLDLQQGSLLLNSGNLTVNGTLTTAAGASITGSFTAGLILNGTGNLSPVFSANGATLQTFVINQTGGNVLLGSDLTVGSMVNIQQGSLVLNGNDLVINGVLSTALGASLTGSATSGLTLDGTGNISLVFSQGGSLLDTFIVSQSTGAVTLNADLVVGNHIALQQGSLVLNGNNLTANGTFTTLAGATITGSATSGLILDGMGNAFIAFSQNGALLDSFLVSQTNGNVTLNSDVVVGGNVNLQQGSLVLNGKDLTVNGTLSNSPGSTITGSATSGLILDGMGDISLVFTINGALLDVFVVSQTNGNVTLNSDLTVGSEAILQQGSLVLNGNELTINGVLTTDAGASITGNATAGLTLNGDGDVSLIFSPNGALLDVFFVSQTNGDVTLHSDLTVVGPTTLQGSLLLNGNNLIVNGSLITWASGSITGSATSGLILDGTGNATLLFAPNGAILDTFVVSQLNGNVTMQTDLTVAGHANLQQGSLLLNGNDLTINGTFGTSGGATITGSATSGLILDGTGNASLVFAPNSAILDTIVVSQTNGFVSLTADLTITDWIDLQQGSLVLNGNDLTVQGSLGTVPGATITGSPFSSLLLDGTGDISLFFSPTGASLSTFVVSQTSGDVTLNSDLKVSNSLDLVQGSLILNGNDLTVNGALSNSGNATLTGSATSGLILDGTGNITLDFSQNGALLDTLVVSQTNGNVAIHSDLAIAGSLSLQQGNLILGNYNLTLSDDAQITGGNASSYVLTNGTGVLWAFVQAGAAGVTFPCGSVNGYFPAVITQENGASDAHIQVNLANGVFSDGTTGVDITATQSLVNHTWFIGTSDANATLDLGLKFTWNAGAEVNGFDHGDCFISHYENNLWDTQATAQAVAEGNGYFSITRDNVTSLSPFRVVDGALVSVSNPMLRDVQLFPNPVTEDASVVLRLDSPKDVTVQIRVFNTTGQLLRTEAIPLLAGSNDFGLTTADLKAGIYWIDIREEGQGNGVVRKFVKM